MHMCDTRRRLLAGATLVVVGVLATAASRHLFAAADAGSWPQWRGPARDGLSPETGLLKTWGPEGPPLAWQASGLGAGFSGVSIGANRIYTMGDLGGEQFVLALAGDSGKLLWKTKVGPAWDD